MKVLYTFDDQNKTNCLARWPQVLQIQTVQIEDNAMIGVIELKTCIQAIVQCSPELVAKLGQDYTVYAYDYSEYDNPLVGQGMLSWALSTASPTPEAPAGRQLITGRVCKNIQGLFSNGVAETLEVKLRLVPVPTVQQSDYISSLERYREMSKSMPPGFDHNEWFAFLQANPHLSQPNSRLNTPVPAMSVSQRQGTSMEIVNQLLSPSLQPNNAQANADPFNNPYRLEKPASNSRPASPAGVNPAKPNSRPSSRTSVKRPRKSRAKAAAKIQNHGGNTSGYEEGTDGDDVPMAKKRATVSKTNWNSKSSFGTAPDSLRVAASTSGSLRLFRPIAIAPGGNGPPGSSSYLQETARAPTPVPQLPPLPRSKHSSGQNSMRRHSILSKATLPQRQYNSPYPPSDAGYQSATELHPSIESAMTSPEKEDSPADTPPDITSSPPRLIGSQSARSTPACPSSPVLPPMPKQQDSGYMSNDISELLEDPQEAIPSPRPATETVPEGDATATARRTRTRQPNVQPPRPPQHHGFAILEVTPGPPDLLPTRMLPRPEEKKRPEQKPMRKALARTNSTMSEGGPPSAPDMQRQDSAPQLQQSHPLSTMRSVPFEIPPNMDPALFEEQPATFSPVELSMPTALPQALVRRYEPIRPPSKAPSRPMSRTESFSELPMPAVPASEPATRPTSLQHAHTWSEAPHARTDAPSGREDSEQPIGSKKGNVAHMQKKKGIQSRLEAAIAKGEMPPYCTNCGAISTPTWRKAWAIEMHGDPGYHEYSDQPGCTTAIDILAKDDDGKPTSYRLIKKSLLPSEDKTLFTEILLCNPCGIWMSKYKSQRPEDRWLKDRMEESAPAPKPRKKRARSAKAKAQQGAAPTSEANFYSDAPGPMDRDASQMPDANSFSSEVNIVVTGQQAHVYQRQVVDANREEHNLRMSETALPKAMQSSPARWVGTRHSPIDVEDEEMGTTRRLLFPSPRKDGTPKVLGEVAVNCAASPTDFQSPTKSKTRSAARNKENADTPMAGTGDEDIIRLVEEELARPERPSTPEPKDKDGSSPFKTPTRPTPSHRPITRSVTRSVQRSIRSIRSIRMGGEMMPQRTPTKSPSTVRRSPRHRSVVETPFTATMNRLLSASNTHNGGSPSRHQHLGLDMSIDFGNLPDLNGDLHSDALGFGGMHGGYGAHEQFFSTDMPMPSSPPGHGFHSIYSDPLNMSVEQLEAMDAALWDELAQADHGNGMEGMGGGLVIDESGRASFMEAGGEVVVKVEEEEGTQIEAAQV